MLDRHEPDKQFVDNLEWQIGAEVRRRNRSATAVHPLWRVARVAAVVVVSMALGAAAMGASYQLEESWRRDLLVAGLEVRLELARRHLDLVGQEYERVQQQVGAGVVGEETLAQAELGLVGSRNAVDRLELDLEEVRASGREPRDDVSAPRVGGRDFVSERIELEIDVINQQLQLALTQLEAVQRRHEVGVERSAAVENAQLAMRAIQSQRSILRGRLAFRQSFLDGEISALEAELYVLRAEAESKESVLRSQYTAVASEYEEMRSRVAVGVVDSMTLLQYEMRLNEVEAELRLAEQEQQIIQRQLDARRQDAR